MGLSQRKTDKRKDRHSKKLSNYQKKKIISKEKEDRLIKKYSKWSVKSSFHSFKSTKVKI
jgi:hypothetical protein